MTASSVPSDKVGAAIRPRPSLKLSSPYRRRRFVDRFVRGLCVLATVLAIVPLLAILAYITVNGISALSLDLFTKPVMEGGIANCITGTLTLVALACAFGVPLGVLAGVYLSEFGNSRFGRAVRLSADVLAGMPSIIAGLFIYAAVVKPMKGPSAIAGGLALAMLMLPTVMRTTEELLRLVPQALREGALALGVPKWRAILRVVLRTAAPGIATGVVLAVARVTGETAPLLYTVGDSQYFSGPFEQTASLTVSI